MILYKTFNIFNGFIEFIFHKKKKQNKRNNVKLKNKK